MDQDENFQNSNEQIGWANLPLEIFAMIIAPPLDDSEPVKFDGTDLRTAGLRPVFHNSTIRRVCRSWKRAHDQLVTHLALHQMPPSPALLFPSLANLRLDYYVCSAEWIRSLASLPHLRGLQHISHSIRTSDSFSAAKFRAVCEITNLTAISLTSINAYHLGCPDLRPLTALTALASVDLSRSVMSVEVATTLNGLPALASLDVSYTDWSQVPLDDWLPIGHPVGYRQIALHPPDDTPFGYSSTGTGSMFIQSLGPRTSLTSLKMHGGGEASDSLVQLLPGGFDAIARCTSLRRLHLADCSPLEWDSDWDECPNEMLQALPLLEDLKLDQMFTYETHQLATLTNLTRLDLEVGEFNEEFKLAELLSALTNLTSVDLYLGHIALYKMDGVDVDSVAALTNLTRLHILGGVDLTEEDKQRLDALPLSTHKRLKEFHIESLVYDLSQVIQATLGASF